MTKKPLVDARRRRYVPLDSQFAFGDFGTKLEAKWGMEGLCMWMLFLAACKREPVEGTLTYTSDTEAFGKLGATPTLFTLDEFWRFTGQHHKTRRRRHGRISTVICRPWDDWNEDWKRNRDAEQKARSRAEKALDKETNVEGQNNADARSDTEVDLEVDLNPPTPLSREEQKRLERWVLDFAVPSNMTDPEIADYLKRHGADELMVQRLLGVAAKARAA